MIALAPGHLDGRALHMAAIGLAYAAGVLGVSRAFARLRSRSPAAGASVRPRPPGYPGTARFVSWTLRYGAVLWGLAILLAVPAAVRTVDLYAHLRTEIEELLPPRAPSVTAIAELRARLPGLMHLGVVVDSGDAAHLPAAERFVDDLAARIRTYPPDLVRAVRAGDGPERSFAGEHAPLYMDLADLRSLRDRIEARRDWEVAKAQGALLDDGPPPPLGLDDMRARYERRAGDLGRFEDGHFARRDVHTALLLVELGRFDTGRSRAGELFDRVQRDVAELDPARYAPGLRVGYASDVAIQVEEARGLRSDLSLSGVVVVVLVVAVILFHYRWWASVPILLLPLFLSTVFAFGIASLPPFGVTELNSNTAFLGSILVGNGINFGIILLARYAEERRRGAGVESALVVAVAGARTPTLSAALAAGASYASLAFSEFRGFRQFGVIGGVGMVVCWALAFVLMPPLVRWMDRAPTLPPPGRAWGAAFARGVARWRVPVMLVSGLLAVGAVARVAVLGPGQIETDFSKLRRADTWKSGEGYWGRRMDALLGAYVTPTVLLADDRREASAIGARLGAEARRPPLDRMIARVRTLDDLIPPHQAEKLAVVAQIRDDLTPVVRASLPADERAVVDRWLGPSSLAPITVDDLPDSWTIGLRERDGSVGRTVLVYPRPGSLLWQGPALADFVARLRSAAAADVPPGGVPARVAGSLPLSADILARVRHDGALTSGLAFAGVVAVVCAVLGARRSAAMVIAALVLGVLWLTAGAAALGVKINFVNFIAFPITFGIGVDYAVNLVGRWDADGRRSLFDAVGATGGAIALCSATTVIGYSSLLFAQNRALFLFGVLAVLGEVACVVTALVVLPAWGSYLGRGSSTARAALGLARRAGPR